MEAKRLYRSRTNKVIGGVCGGLSDYFNLDVVLIRLIFGIGLIFSGGFPFFILYVALWIAAPIEPIVDGYQPKDDLDTSNPPNQQEK